MTSILLDSTTKSLLAINEFAPAIVFANECVLDTLVVHAIEGPNYKEGHFLTEIASGILPRWSWTRDGRKFLETPVHVVTNDLVRKSRLASVKVRSYRRMAEHLSRIRYRVMRGIDYQDTVHLIKLHQAEGFRTASYDEERLLEFPFVLQYSEFKNITPKQAAEDIIVKASFESNYLLTTESLRLKYTKKIREAGTASELSGIHEDFMRECYRNTMV